MLERVFLPVSRQSRRAVLQKPVFPLFVKRIMQPLAHILSRRQDAKGGKGRFFLAFAGRTAKLLWKEGETMLEDSLQKIQQAETAAEQEKAACRGELQRMLADAESAAAGAAARAEETLRQEQEALLKQVEQEASQARDEILRKTTDQCGKLKAQAKANSGKAVEMILARGV